METTRRIVRFGLFEFDPESGELRKQGLKIRLPDQPLRMLELLLERPGEVITREAVRRRLWPGDTFVDFDAGLNNALKKLRDALGDPAENPQFVETLPRRGYRFIGAVHPVMASEPTSELPAAPPISRAVPRGIAGAVLVAVLSSAAAVVYQHGWWPRLDAGAATGRIRALAVLPFENFTGDPAQEYLAEGVTGALTTTLAQAGGFQVVSRTSAMQYRSAKKSLPAIARELNVDAVLEGSIMRSGQDVRVTAQLIDAATDRHIWARSYEGEPGAVLELQQQIARAIAIALQHQVKTLGPVRAASAREANPEAYEAYVNGAFAMGRQTIQGYSSAVEYFEDAVAREPEFAEAHGALAQAQVQLLFDGPLSPREIIPKAEAAARRALQLDDTLAQPHRTLGTILNNFYWRWEDGAREFRRARERAASTDTRTVGAMARTMARAGRFEEAIAEAESASQRDPRSFNAHMNAAVAYRAAGQHEQAIARFRRALEINPAGTRAHFQLGATFVMMDRHADAIGELETAVAQSQANPRFEAYLGYTYAAAGRRVDALRILKELESRAWEQYVSSFGIALIYDALGQSEPALTALERAYQERAVEFAQMAQYPSFTTIAADPRYGALMQRIGLPR